MLSTIFQRPAWQTGPGVPPGVMRIVPDVAFPASSRAPGFVIAIGGSGTTVGGTSVGAPVWASLVALLVQQKGRLGLLQPRDLPAGRAAGRRRARRCSTTSSRGRTASAR